MRRWNGQIYVNLGVLATARYNSLNLSGPLIGIAGVCCMEISHKDLYNEWKFENQRPKIL